MDEKYKKIIAIIAFCLAVLLFGFLLWTMWQKSSQAPSSPEPGDNNNPDYGLPQAGPIEPRPIITPTDPELAPGQTVTEPDNGTDANSEDRSNKLSSPNSFPTIDATISADGQSIQYYDPLDNKFYRLNEAGEPVLMTDEAFYNVSQVNWAPDKNRAILEYPDGTTIIYNFQSQNQVTLPKHWEDFSFSPSGDSIAFKSIGLEPENRWLSIMSADGTQAKNIERLGLNADKASVAWSPNGQIVAIFQDGYDYNRKEVFFIGLNNENFKSMLVQGRGFQSQWSPNGQKILYSVYSDFNGYRPSIWLADANVENIGDNTQPLAVETWSEKCSFANDTTVYCGVPRSLDEGAGMMPSSRVSADDDLYRLNLETGTKELIITEGGFNMSNLIITNDEATLYFTDQRTGGLFKVPLP